MPGFNKTYVNALKLKVETVDIKEKDVALLCDEMYLKTFLFYNLEEYRIEGFEDLDGEGKIQFTAGSVCS